MLRNTLCLLLTNRQMVSYFHVSFFRSRQTAVPASAGLIWARFWICCGGRNFVRSPCSELGFEPATRCTASQSRSAGQRGGQRYRFLAENASRNACEIWFRAPAVGQNFVALPAMPSTHPHFRGRSSVAESRLLRLALLAPRCASRNSAGRSATGDTRK